MVNENINKFIPESVKKPIATVSYFNEAEWNKDLSKEDLKWQGVLETSYLIEQEAQLPSYGPCSYAKCPHDSKIRFYLIVGFKQDRLWNWHFGSSDWITMANIAQGYDAEKKFEDGTYYVKGATGDSTTDNAKSKKAEIMNFIHACIKSHEDGKDIYNAQVDFNYD